MIVRGMLVALAAMGAAVRVQDPPPKPPEDRVRHYAVVCSSYSGSKQHATWYWGSSTLIYRVLREKYGYDDECIYFLYEDPSRAGRVEEEADKTRKVTIDGQSNLENFRKVLDHLAGIVREEDQVFFFMIGHTGFGSGDSWYATVGPDLSSAEFAELIDKLNTKHVHAIFSPCQTEGFIWKAGKPGRVIITSTRASEANRAGVAEAAIRGLENMDYDLDKDGRLSLFEAYQSVVKEQRDWYKAKRMEQDEHALIDDTGDAKGHYLPDGEDAEEGKFAKTVFLGAEGRKLKLSKTAIKNLSELNKNLKLEKLLDPKTDGR
jgi:hypothetical protein